MTAHREGGPGAGAASLEERSQLEWEARAGRLAAAAAFAAALLPMIGSIVSATSIGPTGGDTGEFLVAVEESSAGVLIGATVVALGTALLPIALGYLHRATLARRPQAARLALPLIVASSLGLAVTLVLQQVLVLDVAGDFAAGADQTEATAEELLETSALSTTAFVDAGLKIALGASIILISLNAMRAGLLGRFMGIIGIGLGIFYAVPIPGLADPTLIQLFWAIALGFLFLGRWPGGERGPAWSRVEAVPWPTAADRMQAQRDAQVAEAQAATEKGHAQEAPAGDPTPRPASRKRRRSG